VIDMINEVRCW